MKTVEYDPEIQPVILSIRGTIYRQIEIGDFPKPIPLSKRRIGFLLSEVGYWLDDRRLS